MAGTVAVGKPAGPTNVCMSQPMAIPKRPPNTARQRRPFHRLVSSPAAQSQAAGENKAVSRHHGELI
jgi:hypothetical protein